MIRFSVPLRVKSLNAREHWRAKARRVAEERGDTRMAALHQLGAEAAKRQPPDPASLGMALVEEPEEPYTHDEGQP